MNAIKSHQCDYDCDYITRSTTLVLPQTSRSQAEKYPDSGEYRLHDKTLRIQKCSDSKFPLKIPDSKSPESLVTQSPNRGVRPLECKQRNQSGTKTFRIRDESETISSSVNLVFRTSVCD